MGCSHESATPEHARRVDSGRNRAGEFVRLIRDHYFDDSRVDWVEVEHKLATCLATSDDSTTVRGCLALAISMLADEHSRLIGSMAAADSIPEPYAECSEVGGWQLNARVGLLQLRTNDDCEFGFARRSLRLIDSLREAGSVDWVVDMRHMGGGYIANVLGALSPLLDSDTIGGVVDNSGARGYWIRSDSGVELVGSRVCGGRFAEQVLSVPPSSRVVVLVSNATQSAGEAGVLALMRRRTARVVGTVTAGKPHCLATVDLGEGHLAAIAAGRFLDASDRPVNGGIHPFKEVQSNIIGDNDAMFRLALELIESPRSW